jgi:hypothetical protein
LSAGTKGSRFPTASSSVHPKILSAAGFHIVTTPRGSKVTIARGDASISVPRTRFALRSWSKETVRFIKSFFGRCRENL